MRVYRYFISQKKFFEKASYEKFCDTCQKDEAMWKVSSLINTEILLRAFYGARDDVKYQEFKNLEISITDIVEKNLEYLVYNALERKNYGFIHIITDDSFENVERGRIISDVKTLAPDKLGKVEKLNFYAGHFSDTFKPLYLNDGNSVFLDNSSDGKIYEALKNYLKTEAFDRGKIAIISEMQNKYSDVYERRIRNSMITFQNQYERAYLDVERDFDEPEYPKQDVISILSWFRHNGYSPSGGGGNLYSEKSVQESYRSEPWRFLYEFIQNADDCNFKNKHPSLSVVIKKEENKVVFEYNEEGFQLDDIIAITKFGKSDKSKKLDEIYLSDGVFDRNLTGKMGIGFKAVFALPGENIVVHVNSNGFTFKFVKKLGAIIPIWDDSEAAIEEGTRITVEGFETNSINAFYEKLLFMIGGKSNDELFATCPSLFLRKLKNVTLSNGVDTFSIDICSSEKLFFDKLDIDLQDVNCGIISDKILYKKMIEKLCLNVSGYERVIEAIRVSEYFNIANEDYVISEIAPIIKNDDKVKFGKGSLYSTLPLYRNRMSIPVAINTTFALDDNRSKVCDMADKQEVTDSLLNYAFNSVLQELYSQLREVEEIDPEPYVISGEEIIFGDESYHYVTSISISGVINKIEFLRLYSGKGYVSVARGKKLPEECYSWSRCDLLGVSFGLGSDDLLVDERYVKTSLKIKEIKLLNKNFVENLNSYLDALSDEEYNSVLELGVYPYLIKNRDTLDKIYEDHMEKLSEMMIFKFKGASGVVLKEDASCSDIFWIQTNQNLSCGDVRPIMSSIIQLPEDLLKWISKYKKIYEPDILFKKLYDEEFIIATDWQSVSSWIKTLLFYGFENMGNIRYLKSCVLSETLDPEYNIFRCAYEESGNKRILSYVISENDILDISTELEQYGTDLSVFEPENVIKNIQSMGLRSQDDFLIADKDNNMNCNAPTLEILREYSGDELKITDLLQRVVKKYDLEKKRDKHVGSLYIAYDSIKDCSLKIINVLLRESMLEGSVLKRLAKEYYWDNANKQKDIDTTEVLIRCLAVLDETFGTENYEEIYMELSVREIIERKMGKAVQEAMLKQSSVLSLNIQTVNEKVSEYPKEDINNVIDWMKEKSGNVLDINELYEYVVYDINNAFLETMKKDELYIFDSQKVILNDLIPENAMLSFVQSRFKGEAVEYSRLLEIIKEQNELNNLSES